MIYRAIISLFILSTFSIHLSAQTDTTKENANTVATDNYIPQNEFNTIRLGINGSLGASWMGPKTTEYSSYGSIFAYSYGLLVDYNFTKRYTFSTGINLSRLGGKLNYPDSASVVNSTKELGSMYRAYHINYLEIPTLLKLKTNQMGYLTYFVQLGLRHSFRLSSYSNDEFIYNNATKTLTTKNNDMHDYTTFYRLSLSLGIGAEYAISQTFSAYGYINYGNGLTNSLKKLNTISGKKENAFISKLSITTGFLF